MVHKILALASIAALALSLQFIFNSRFPMTNAVAFPAVAFDGSGNVVVTYVHYHHGYSELESAQREGSDWLRKTVDSSGVGRPSLAIDRSGKPAVSYGDQTVRFARWNGDRWITERVDEGGYSSLAFDASRKPAIAYVSGDGGLRFAHRTVARWTTETVGGVESCGSTSLGFDSSGSPVIGYTTDNNVGVARRSGSTWGLDTLETGSFQSPSLAFDGTGKPAIAYIDRQDLGLRLGRWDGTKWVVQTVTTGDVGIFASLAFDSWGNPALAASYVGLFVEVMLVRWDGTKWAWSTVDPRDVAVQSSESLAFDPSGNPTIAYYCYRPAALRLARWDGVEWVREKVRHVNPLYFYYWGVLPVVIILPLLSLVLRSRGFYSGHPRLVLGSGGLAVAVGLGCGIGFAVYTSETHTYYEHYYALDLGMGLVVLASLAVSLVCVVEGIIVLVRLWLARRGGERPA